VQAEERAKIEKFLRSRFNGAKISVRARPRKDDSAEVYLADEFIGTISRDDDEGELAYHFTMSILEMDLEE
jgi:hypothetical protein